MTFETLDSELSSLRLTSRRVGAKPAQIKAAHEEALALIADFRKAKPKLSDEEEWSLVLAEATALAGLGKAEPAVARLAPLIPLWKKQPEWANPQWVYSNQALSQLFAQCGAAPKDRAASIRLAQKDLRLDGSSLDLGLAECALEARELDDARKQVAAALEKLSDLDNAAVQRSHVMALLLKARIEAVAEDLDGVVTAIAEARRVNHSKAGVSLDLDQRVSQAKELRKLQKAPRVAAALKGEALPPAEERKSSKRKS